MCVLLQDGDVLEENIILKWWAGLTASHDKAVASSTDAKDFFGEAITASSTAIEKEREAAEVSSTKVADEKFYKKQAENAKCGQAATAEEEAWEKEVCARPDRQPSLTSHGELLGSSRQRSG